MDIECCVIVVTIFVHNTKLIINLINHYKLITINANNSSTCHPCKLTIQHIFNMDSDLSNFERVFCLAIDPFQNKFVKMSLHENRISHRK